MAQIWKKSYYYKGQLDACALKNIFYSASNKLIIVHNFTIASSLSRGRLERTNYEGKK